MLFYGGPFLLNYVREINRQFNILDEPATAEHPGHGSRYVLKLPPMWEEMPAPPGCDIVLASSNKLVAVSIEIVDQLSGGPDEIARFALQNMSHAFSQPVVELGRRRVTHQGKEWLQVDVHSKPPGIPFSQFQVLNFYAGPEGKFIIVSSAAAIYMNWMPARREALRHIVDGFQLPPPNLEVQKLDETPAALSDDPRYSILPPAGWAPAPAWVQKTFPNGRLFQYGEVGNAFFGVMMEPLPALQLIPRDLAEGFKRQIESHGGEDAEASDIETMRIGTRNWIRFRIRAKVSSLDFTYLYAVCSGKEALCTTVSWTLTRQMKDTEPQLEKIFTGLRLNFD